VRRAGGWRRRRRRSSCFAQSLAADDQVALEATGNALAIARIIEPHVDRIVLANPKAVKNATRSAKTDRLDACTLARLLAAGFSARGVDAGRADARVLGRRISRRGVSLRSFAAAS
jgi:transposase